MELGVHLPLADLGEGAPTGEGRRAYARTASALDYAILSANDHLVWQRPWLDGPTALASVLGEAAGMTLATSVALPTVRHPVVLAKAISSLAVLSGGPVIAGLGPGSSAADHTAVGVGFDDRWARFDEGLRIVRSLVRGEPVGQGRLYPGADVRLDPLPASPPQVWFGSWGSDARLRSMASAADGWFASAYNTTPPEFAEARARLDGHLAAAGRDPGCFPDGVATMWTYVTEDPAEARSLLEDVMAPVLRRDPQVLRGQLAIGTAEHCAGLLRAYARAGAQRMLLWPVRDPIGQLHAVAERVRPHLGRAPTAGMGIGVP
jgi:alkanesulfonate monooxygenase SsuD/methylene tetrahydromethanopterin reductase-like flavin-dependent oxidoreductase (luciferase family)